MATFFNQASLSYGGETVNSNITEAELLSGLQLTKTGITPTYTAGGNAVYAITLSNMGSVAYNALTVTDDLGAYNAGTGTVVPLTYVDGSMLYYLNGELQPAPTVTAAGNLEISGINLPAGSTATFIYEVRANEFAPVAAGSVITNTASVNGGVGVGVITDTAQITVEEAPRLTIAKAVCPAVITDNSELTYTLIVQNLGNTAIVATDGVTVNDVFNPALSNITVTLDGVTLAEGVGYTYDEESGAFATTDGTLTVPAATYTRDPVTGAISTTPGVAVITVTGTV
ncbi:MAG: DUF11 domain-containing protein [Clostridia bacterium]|nr:DUF11 domain-containing protein [Clostridia bacterium]